MVHPYEETKLWNCGSFVRTLTRLPSKTKIALLQDGSPANWSRPQVEHKKNQKNCHNVPHKSIVMK